MNRLFSKTGLLHRRLIEPAVTLLVQGVTPERVAWCIALGAGISICPLLGLPTVLCTLIPLTFRLNLPLMQAVNYLGTIPQWALIIPFVRIGERLFAVDRFPLSVGEIQSRMQGDFWGTMAYVWEVGWHAGLVWLLCLPIVSGVLYLLLVPWTRRLAATRNQDPRPS